MKIALLGYGVEAQSAYKYYSRLYPDARFTIYENAPESKLPVPEGVEFYGNAESFQDIDADIVVKTPAINPKKVSSNGKVTTVTKEFLAKCPAPIIGVTGTKGKGTTCTLITEILKAAGKTVHLVGNIGVPALDELGKVGADDIVVYELSSFQLWDVDKSPHVAVVLMVEDEHLDVHENSEDYIEAKRNIVKYQTSDDVCVYYSKNKTSSYIGESSKGKKIPFEVEGGDFITIEGQQIIAKSDVKLIGEHNLQNVYAAINASWQYTQDIKAFKSALETFSGLPHRLERVATKQGVLYINDSFSSASRATIAAINSFEQPVILIAGGLDRNLDYSELAKEIVSKNNIKKVLLMGETKEKIGQELDAVGWIGYEYCDTLKTAVSKATEQAIAGDVVLLSPGCASFDMFENFTKRGEAFKSLVEKT